MLLYLITAFSRDKQCSRIMLKAVSKEKVNTNRIAIGSKNEMKQLLIWIDVESLYEKVFL